jgi:hypothetical protein
MLTPPRLGRFANFFGCFLTGYNNSEALRATLQRPASFLSGCSFPSGCSLPSRYNTKRGNSREPPSSSRKRSFAINKTPALSLVFLPPSYKDGVTFLCTQQHSLHKNVQSPTHRTNRAVHNALPSTPTHTPAHTMPKGGRPPSILLAEKYCVRVCVCV